MTEAEWEASTDPDLMAADVIRLADPRRVRLFACAWGGRLWSRMPDEDCRRAIETGERFADGLATSRELEAAYTAVTAALDRVEFVRGGRHGKPIKAELGTVAEHHAITVARLATLSDLGFRDCQRFTWRMNGATKCALAEILRDIFNPFRPVAVDPRWRTETVVGIARAAYDDRAWDRLPILADALMDAGCDHPDVLAHLRGPGPHVRGCWVLDLLLGKS